MTDLIEKKKPPKLFSADFDFDLPYIFSITLINKTMFLLLIPGNLTFSQFTIQFKVPPTLLQIGDVFPMQHGKKSTQTLHGKTCFRLFTLRMRIVCMPI